MSDTVTHEKTLNSSKNDFESYDFTSESSKLLHVVTHALYSNKEICLRELISNACDALDKLRYQSLLDPNISYTEGELKIKISVDKELETICISDNGIGMSKEELIKNLGTIAKSGTENFIKSIQDNKNKENLNLIGNFGVGFYSSFMIAKKVEVISCKNPENKTHIWTSDGCGQFSIAEYDQHQSRGTKVVLYLKEDSKDYLDKFKIQHLITTYSDHLPFPIFYENEKSDLEQLNSGSAIWERSKNDITEEQHQKFFQSVAHTGGSPWMILHNKSEGAIEYINLLYIPSVKPFDLFHPDRKCSVSLYIKKVFVTDSNVKILPQYMRFIKGIVDCTDLPLNISRETLQHNSAMSKVSSSIENRVINSLEKKFKNDTQDYDDNFWSNFGAVLKEGLCEHMPTDKREKLISICRFYSSLQNKLISIDEYIESMKAGQNFIFYLTSNNLETAKSNPQLEGFSSRQIDVIIMTDSVDDFWVNVNLEYKNVKFQSITREDIDLDSLSEDEQKTENDSEESNSDSQKNVDSVLEYMKKILGAKVSDVKQSKKLSNSPVCLSAKSGAMDIRMERFMFEQNQLSQKSSKIFEVNLMHPIIIKLKDNIETEIGSDIVNLLFYQACINEGEEISNPSDFSSKLNKLLINSF